MPRYEVLYSVLEGASVFVDFEDEPSDGDVRDYVEGLHPLDDVLVSDWYEVEASDGNA